MAQLKFRPPLDYYNFIGGTITHEINATTKLWSDGGGDIFDGWGGFKLTDIASNETKLLPIQDTENGVINSANIDSSVFTGIVNYGYINKSIYYIEIVPDDLNRSYKLTFGGNYGSDTVTQNGTIYSDKDLGNLVSRTYLHWNNDGAMNSDVGDPQWMYSIILKDTFLPITTPPFTSTYDAASIDSETVTTPELHGIARLYFFSGGTTVEAIKFLEYLVLGEDQLYRVAGNVSKSGLPFAAKVRVLSREDGHLIAEGQTDNNGNYSIDFYFSGKVDVIAIPAEGVRPLAHGPVVPEVVV